MTASSVEFFPCRVQLMGLPRPTTIVTAKDSLSSLENSTRPSLAKLKRVSRNLFGTPDPVEMKMLYEQEDQRLRSYIFERYNIDTRKSNPTNKQQEHTNKINQTTVNNSIMQSTPLPTLISRELLQQKQRLPIAEHGLNFTPSETPKSINHAKNTSKITRRHSLVLPATEGQMPYARQPLLTEIFNVRKNKAIVTKNGQQYNDDISLDNNLNSQQNLEILQLPQHINLQNRKFDIKNEENEQSIHRNKNLGMDDNDKNKSINFNDNSTTLSLQLILSTKNVS